MSESVIKKYNEEDIIVRQGDTSRQIYKVISGKVVLYVNYGKEDEYLVGVLSFPKCFGEMTVLIGEAISYTAVALTEATVLIVPEDDFETFIQGDYKNAMSIMKTMAKNLSMANMNIMMLVEELSHAEKADKAKEGKKRHKNVKKKDFVCPHCGNTFRDEYYERPQEDENGNIEEDGFDEKEWYEVITCPKCYFSVIERYFVKNLKLDKSAYESELTGLHSQMKLDFRKKRDLKNVLARHYLAIACASGLHKNIQMKMHLWDNLCVLYEKAGDSSNLQAAIKNEIELCKKMYMTVELSTKQEQKLSMKIAELYYKLNDVNGTMEWIKVLYKDGVRNDEHLERARKIMRDMNFEFRDIKCE